MANIDKPEKFIDFWELMRGRVGGEMVMNCNKAD